MADAKDYRLSPQRALIGTFALIRQGPCFPVSGHRVRSARYKGSIPSWTGEWQHQEIQVVHDTVRQSIAEALAAWDQAAAANRSREAEQLRVQFVERFPVDAWPTMPLTDYALGQDTQDTVSYWLEYKTGVIGSIKGGSSFKHLIFRSRDDGTWRFPKSYESQDAAWPAIRSGFVDILRLAGKGDFDDVDDVAVLNGAPAVRTKLLYMYFPTALVPVSSKSDIDHFLQALGQEAPSTSVVRGNRQLLAALRSISELDSLTNQELGYFLYHWRNPRPSQRVFKIAPGELGKYWPDCEQHGYICVGWDDLGDLTQYESKDEFREAFRKHYPYNGVERQVSRKANELWTLMELQPGDTVIANRGTSEILAIGTVNDEGYVWRPDRQEYRHTVGIDWDTSRAKKIPPVKGWATTTVSKVPATLLRQITGSTSSTFKPVSTDEIFIELEAALNRRGQAILYGPPGTGKTYYAKRAAVWLLDGGSGSEQANALLGDEELLESRERELTVPPSDPTKAARLTRVTFHPSYAYEDFIEGYRPQQADNGMQLVLNAGVFKRVCETARKDPTHRYVLLIDEINRGNIPKIFGELITLIEYDKRGSTWQLPQSGEAFSVPENVLIIGTMNTADRSIHLLDTALRRRFQFIELLPDSNLLQGRVAGSLALDDFLDGLNDEVRQRFGRDKQIGHALFFTNGDIIETPAEFAAVFRYDILPLLQEYCCDDYQSLAEILGTVIDTQAQRLTDFANDPDTLCDELASRFGTASA
ncbi:MAG: AAA family ATPase [Fimbriimonadaceae bacterium]|nr:AAA family ATPase [Fimbriimonadaceae bacterium]